MQRKRKLRTWVKVTLTIIGVSIILIPVIKTITSEEYKLRVRITELTDLHIRNNCQYRGNKDCIDIHNELQELREQYKNLTK